MAFSKQRVWKWPHLQQLFHYGTYQVCQAAFVRCLSFHCMHAGFLYMCLVPLLCNPFKHWHSECILKSIQIHLAPRNLLSLSRLLNFLSHGIAFFCKVLLIWYIQIQFNGSFQVNLGQLNAPWSYSSTFSKRKTLEYNWYSIFTVWLVCFVSQSTV